MLSDRIFRNAFIFSIIAHSLLCYNWPAVKNLSLLKTPSPPIEVTYQSSKTRPIYSENISEKQNILKAAPGATEKAQSPALKIKDMSKPELDLKRPDKPDMERLKLKSSEEPARILPDETMRISHQEKDLSNEPVYLNYYNAIRAKIYKVANADKPSYYAQGDVKLVFTLGNDGRLISAAIIDEGSTLNPALRNHALMSIKKASPFPEFHSSMKERELTLRLTISFER